MSELYRSITDYIESCRRTGHFDMQECIDYFMSENDHMNLDRNEVEKLFEQLFYE